MKKLFSIVLILCTVGAWASIIMKNVNTPKEYEEYLSLAKKAYEQEYYYEAIQWANKARSVEGIDSVYEAEEIRRDSFYGLGEWDQYVSQCQSMTKKFVDEVENYELITQFYLDNEDVKKLCEIVPEYFAKWNDNEIILQAKNKVDTAYRYVMRGLYDVKYMDTEYIEIQTYKSEQVGDTIKTGRKIIDGFGNEIFSYDYALNVPAVDYSSLFVCNQEGEWSRVTSANYLLAKNDEVNFESIGRLSNNNIATAIIDGKYKFINEKMKVNDLTWEEAGNFSNGINAVKNDGKWALVNSGNWTQVSEYPYEDIPLNSQGYCTVDGRCVVADTKGYYVIETEEFEPVSDKKYEELKAFESQQPTVYRDGNKWGFVNKYGEVFIEAEYEDAKPYVNGYAPVKVNGLWGYIDSENRMVVQPQFQDALSVMTSGYAYVKNELGYWDYVIIDKLYYKNRR